MPPRNALSLRCARATYAIRPKDIADVLLHRKVANVEEYLVRWSFGKDSHSHRARCSWHTLPELWKCLHLVQLYLEYRPRPEDVEDQLPALPVNRKRKSPETDQPSRDQLRSDILRQNGLLTPRHLTPDDRSRSPSVMSNKSDQKLKITPEYDNLESQLYGVTLSKKEGSLLARESDSTPLLNPKKLPQKWLQAAASTSVDQAEQFIRERFREMLKPVGNCYLENNVDSSTPSLNFTFITKYAFRNGISETPLDAVAGCQYPCKPNMGGFCGCEYTTKCACLEFADVDEVSAASKDPKQFAAYKAARERNEHFDTTGMPKRFPYSKASKDGNRPQTLVSHYLNSRSPIYECNPNCNCGEVCKSRLVQKGRKVPLTIFKTPDRGWGVYCNEDLVRGEFIDTYLGEVITADEAEEREEKAGSHKDSYLYTLDKFEGEDDGLGNAIMRDDCHVVDGQYMGGPTRFINHSCEPNCAQYVVSYNKNDLYVYNLAFFAFENIPAGTELTFDYVDPDPDPDATDEDMARRREEALLDEKNKDKIRCNCGQPRCRGFLW